MSNDYFTVGDALADHTQARGTAVDAKFSAVEAGFDKLPSTDELTAGTATYCDDTGTANTYVLTPPHTISAYTEGQRFSFFAANTNTGASTVNISGKGARALKRADGTALAANDILAGAPVEIIDNGTDCRMVGWHGSDLTTTTAAAVSASASASAASGSASAASGSAVAAAASAVSAAASAAIATATVAQWAVAGGSADVITGAFPTTVTALTDGLILSFRAIYDNATTTPTFKADGTTARTIVGFGGGAIRAGNIQADGEYFVRYKLADTRWELLNPTLKATEISFTAILTSSVNDVTGDGTVYPVVFNSATVNEGSAYNTSTGVFTATVAGRYAFSASIHFSGALIGNDSAQLNIVTTSKSFICGTHNPYKTAGAQYDSISTPMIISNLAAGETASVTFVVANGTKVIDILGSTTGVTTFSGFLISGKIT